MQQNTQFLLRYYNNLIFKLNRKLAIDHWELKSECRSLKIHWSVDMTQEKYITLSKFHKSECTHEEAGGPIIIGNQLNR